MSDEMSALNEYRSFTQRSRENLRNISKSLGDAAKGETDQFKRVVAKGLSRDAAYLEDIFSNLEGFAILTSGLKSQNELLRDILVQLSEVKNNPQMLKDIENAFREYNESYRKQYESFKRHRDDLGL